MVSQESSKDICLFYEKSAKKKTFCEGQESIRRQRNPIAFNHLKPTGHVTHHQFNIQQLYVLPTLYLCVSYLSENKQRLVPITA